MTKASVGPRLIRPTWAEIDVNAFRHNLAAVADHLPRRVKIMAVLKADGYGHGASPLAKAASVLGNRLWGFGVSSVEEGVALREAGLKEKILVLGSLFPFDSFDTVLDHHLIPTVASRASASALVQRAQRRGRPAPCHLKIDTGMGRIGMSPEAFASFPKNPWLQVDGIYTHLACADSASVTAHQLKLFNQTIKGFEKRGESPHVGNSGGVLARPASHYSLVRPGLVLYGIVPWPALGRTIDLRPVLSWKTRVVFLKTVPKGTPLSYGWTWRTRRRSRIATLPVGYADGYRRDLSNKGQVLVKGRRCPVVGRVTMDQILVDVSGLTGVEVGEEVVLLGRQGRDQVRAEEMADWAKTISYEILCGISKRVPRVLT
ncbi:MAG: alanine racemase [Elusimicrobia bacterium]|nr:alanine racemase [Elusimicrobiota bacterium]